VGISPVLPVRITQRALRARRREGTKGAQGQGQDQGQDQKEETRASAEAPRAQPPSEELRSPTPPSAVRPSFHMQ
jgi:hypothetical protein